MWYEKVEIVSDWQNGAKKALSEQQNHAKTLGGMGEWLPLGNPHLTLIPIPCLEQKIKNHLRIFEAQNADSAYSCKNHEAQKYLCVVCRTSGVLN